MAHTLPENESEWPRDPWRVLGVSRGADERSVRRAYAALIRQYKPDAFPSQFQRIRLSYETVLAQVQARYEPDDSDEDAPPPFPVFDRIANVPSVEPGHMDEPVHTDEPVPPAPIIDPPVRQARDRRLSESDCLAEAWRLATEHSPEEAAAFLDHAELERQRSPEVRLARYWFGRLAARTAADAREQPLFATSAGSLNDHRLLLAYLAALRDHPEALSERCRDLMLATSIDGAWRIASLRWKALAAQGMWWKVDQDLVLLLERDSIPVSSRILLILEVAGLRVWESSDYHETFWQETAPIVDDWLNEARNAMGLADRWDALLQLRGDCARLDQPTEFGEAARPFRRLLRAMATGSCREVRSHLVQELQHWRFNYGQILGRLTLVRQETPTLFFELARQIHALDRRHEELSLTPARLATLFNEQVDLGPLLNRDPTDAIPPAVARSIYEFCTRSGCTLSTVIRALAVTNKSVPLLRSALPLDLLIEGSLLFWEL